MNDIKYVGLLENNEHEGETFGFYFPDTEEVRSLLESVIVHFKTLKWSDGGEYPSDEYYIDDTYELDLDGYTKNDLKMIEKGADNGYMARCNIAAKPFLILEKLLAIPFLDNLPYKGTFTIDNEEYDMRGPV